MARIELRAEVTGKVWKIVAESGATVEADDTILIVESMKMEIPVTAERSGTLLEIKVAEGESVEDGQVVAVMDA